MHLLELSFGRKVGEPVPVVDLDPINRMDGENGNWVECRIYGLAQAQETDQIHNSMLGARSLSCHQCGSLSPYLPPQNTAHPVSPYLRMASSCTQL